MTVTDGNQRGGAARPERVDRELSAARRLMASGASEIDDVLSAVAAKLVRELDRDRDAVVVETTPLAAERTLTAR